MGKNCDSISGVKFISRIFNFFRIVETSVSDKFAAIKRKISVIYRKGPKK